MNSLNIGYSGLSTSQVGIDVTGHNISNAETEGYTRQRVVQTAATPVSTGVGNVGNGVDVEKITRVFDNFVFDRYRDVSAQKEYSSFNKQTLDELSTYFPEVDGVGIKSDLSEYYNTWQNFSDNPSNDAVKIALSKQTQTLSEHIKYTREQVHDLQMEVNDQLEVNVNEVNSLAKQLADVNKSIDSAEAGDMYVASDLRDQRNNIEKNIAKLVGANVLQGKFTSDMGTDPNANIRSGSYTLSINGYNIVDGGTVHPLKVSKDNNPNGFYEVSYERQDGILMPLEETITGGKIGAIFALRGKGIDTTTGMPTDGVLQTTLSNLDSFSQGLIERTNNIYAQSATKRMESNGLDIDDSDALVGSNYNIKEGSFDIVIYDIDGTETARRSINIDDATSLSGSTGSNSIEGQIKENKDDNDDNNATNDIDDMMVYNYQSAANGERTLELALDSDALSKGYTFSIEDGLTSSDFSSGTNFAGALGLGRFFDGDSAKNIDLNFKLAEDPSTLHAGYSSANGDNRIALDMVQQQFEDYDFKVGDKTYNTTTYGMFDVTATYVGIETNAATTRDDTIATQYNAIEMEYNSVSKVSIDEEMTNLIKYQTSYGASAKLITTIDQMMQTLLGIKQ
jgi:flagellar hook-associated protein 1 FlgK